MEVKRTLNSLHKEKDVEQLKNGLSFVSQSIPFPFEDKMKLSRCYYEMKGNKSNKILLLEQH